MKKILTLLTLTTIVSFANTLPDSFTHLGMRADGAKKGDFIIIQGQSKFSTNAYHILAYPEHLCLVFIDDSSKRTTTICGSFIVQDK